MMNLIIKYKMNKTKYFTDLYWLYEKEEEAIACPKKIKSTNDGVWAMKIRGSSLKINIFKSIFKTFTANFQKNEI